MQGGIPAACATLTPLPATLNVADLDAEVLAATVYVRDLEPVPDDADTLAHVASLPAVHAHCASLAVIEMVPVAPSCPGLRLGGVTTYVHAIAASEIATDWPPASNVAVRGRMLEFGAMA